MMVNKLAGRARNKKCYCGCGKKAKACPKYLASQNIRLDAPKTRAAVKSYRAKVLSGIESDATIMLNPARGMAPILYTERP